MASSFVWFGVLFLFLAIIGYIFPINESTMGGMEISVTIPEAVGICNSAMGQLGQAFSGEAVKTCSEYNILINVIYGSGVLGLILIVVGAVIPSKSKGKKDPSSLEILKERYAKGEITQKEFDKMKKDLE